MKKGNKYERSLWKTISSISIVLLFLVSTFAPAVTASISPTTLEATLKPGESVSETKIVSIPDVPPRADVIFAFDLTGSMSGIIDTAKTNAGNIMNQLDAIPGVDIDYGVMSYMDYPNSYSSYGYSAQYGDALSGDYAYKLNHAITSDNTAVSTAINALVIGWGADGPQDYTRIMYESYADPKVAWRSGAKKIIINFGDNVPHDDDLNAGVVPAVPPWSTGGDPGTDEIILNADDLDLQTVLAAMSSNGVTLIEAHTQDWPVEWQGGPTGHTVLEYWKAWTAITGGQTFITDSATLVDDVVGAVTAALKDPTINDLHLQASPGYETWLSSVTPPSYSGPTGVDVNFNIVVTVPAGTPCGDYRFVISAVDKSGVNYGDQTVIIHVPCSVPGRMTGGGSVFTNDNSRVTHGFELKCDKSQTPNNLEVNWGKGNKFHLETLTTASCSDDPAIEPNPPAAGFDTYKGTGTGRYNGAEGATAEWTFTDAGEPGKNDIATIVIKDSSGNIVLSVSGNLNGGNQQAHKE